MRIALLLSSLAFAACTVGEVDSVDNNSSGSNSPDACTDRLATPGPATVHPAGIAVSATNTSNAGENCVKGGCHLNNNLGPNAPGFQFGGTIYKQGTTQPDAGVAVRLVSNGMPLQPVYTDQAGNFYFNAGTLMGSFMANTSVSACPTVTKMVTLLVGGSGDPTANNCNFCHTTAAGAMAAPIFLQ